MLPALLVLLLGHPSFPVREAADTSLCKMGHLAVPALMAGEQSTDPEIKQRSAMLLDAWRQDCMVPYIDALPYSYPNRDALIYKFVKLAESMGFARKVGRDWPAYREATRLWLLDGGGDSSLLGTMRVRTACYNCIGRWEPD